MRVSIEDTRKIGKGMKAEALIKKGTNFWTEKPFATMDLLGKTKNDRRVGIVSSEAATLAMQCLHVYDGQRDRLERFLAGHHIGDRPINHSEIPVAKIAAAYKCEPELVERVYRCCQSNMFGATLLLSIGCKECALFDKGSFANNRCVNPNAVWVVNPDTCVLKFFALRDIQPGEWITISYLQGLEYGSAEERAQQLKTHLGFQCVCDDCVSNAEHVHIVFGQVGRPNAPQKFWFDWNKLDACIQSQRALLLGDVISTAGFMMNFHQRLSHEIDACMFHGKWKNWPQVSKASSEVLMELCNLMHARRNRQSFVEDQQVFGACLSILVLSSDPSTWLVANLKMAEMMNEQNQQYGIDMRPWFAMVMQKLGLDIKFQNLCPDVAALAKQYADFMDNQDTKKK
jgi:hypothetical protein